MKKEIRTDKAPKAIGPYSQAINYKKEKLNVVYTSGQLPINPITGEMPDDIASQTKESLQNVKAVLESADLSMDNVVKTTVYLADMNDFAAMNEVYNKYFSKPYPARSAVAVKTLPKNALVEIEAVAYGV